MLSHKLSRSPHYKWWVFAAVGLGSFTGVMTFGTVNVALPTIAGHFETDLPTVQWVVIALALIGALLLMDSKLFFRESRGVRFDWPGAAMSTAALVIFLMPMTNGYRAFNVAGLMLASAGIFTISRDGLPAPGGRSRIFPQGSGARRNRQATQASSWDARRGLRPCT